jgi:glycosyltransferase involved in cell wall biosynthesis
MQLYCINYDLLFLRFIPTRVSDRVCVSPQKTSVLILNRDNAAHLAECIDSVLTQSLGADEIIVHDDGSQDGSSAVARSFGARVQWIAGERPPNAFPPHVNQGRAIHEAFRRSTGDIVFLLSSDDTFHPGRIARYREAFARNPAALLVQSPLSWIDGFGRRLPRRSESFKHVADPLTQAYLQNDADFFYATSGLAFPRSFLSKTLPIDWSDDVPLGCDTRLCLAAMLAGPVVTLADELGSWRRAATPGFPRAHAVRQTWWRTRVFNELSESRGGPPLRIWQNRRFYLRLLRSASPPAVFEQYRAWRQRPAHNGAAIRHSPVPAS